MKDRFANDAARAANPVLKDIGPDIDLHPDYEPTMKRLVLDLIKNDPIWYARILAMRILKITFLPFQGSWMMSVGDPVLEETVKLGSLLNGANLYRFYIVGDTITAVLDLALTLLGAFVLLGILIRNSWQKTAPYVLLLLATLHVYAVVMASNRNIFLAGTFFYEFFAVMFLSKWVISAAAAWSSCRKEGRCNS
jgi:hypothetical protein